MCRRAHNNQPRPSARAVGGPQPDRMRQARGMRDWPRRAGGLLSLLCAKAVTFARGIERARGRSGARAESHGCARIQSVVANETPGMRCVLRFAGRCRQFRALKAERARVLQLGVRRPKSAPHRACRVETDAPDQTPRHRARASAHTHGARAFISRERGGRGIAQPLFLSSSLSQPERCSFDRCRTTRKRARRWPSSTRDPRPRGACARRRA